MPAPDLVRVPAPEMIPDRVTAAVLSMVAAEDRLIAWVMVAAPVIDRLPPLSVIAPDSRLPAVATDTVPAETVVAPVPVCVPLRVSVPAPDLVRSPEPDRTPTG